MYCQKCGTQMAEGTQFCTSCGAPMNPSTVRMSAANVPLQPASGGRRLANFFVDWICAVLFVTVLDVITALLHTPKVLASILGFVYVLGYYVFFEGIWQRTPGKWATGTKVVREDGTKPKFMQILGRSLCRLIPFEALSFVVVSHPVGWHDRFPHTLVVSNKLTPDDVKNFNWAEIKKHKNNIVVVVIVCVFAVIAVIGILASIVLTSLGSARMKAQNSEIESTLGMARAQAEVYYDQNDSSYSGFCDSGADGLIDMDNPQDAHRYVCNDSDDSWAMSAKLEGDNGYACVDDSDDVAPASSQIGPDDVSCSDVSMPGDDTTQS